MQKIIGLIPLYDDEKDSYWMIPGYMKAIELCGATPIMLPLTENKETLQTCFDLCDGLLMTGGHDVNPALYGEEKLQVCGDSCSIRDNMEKFLFNEALKFDKPVLGICRGIQLMNVLLGGTLYQDLPSQKPTNTEHHMTPPYDRAIHKVTILDNTYLADLIGKSEYGVNSYHHQAIKDLAPNVTAMAYSEDNLVEAIKVNNKKFIVGVQWHPELAYKKDEKSLKLIQDFVDNC